MNDRVMKQPMNFSILIDMNFRASEFTVTGPLSHGSVTVLLALASPATKKL